MNSISTVSAPPYAKESVKAYLGYDYEIHDNIVRAFTTSTKSASSSSAARSFSKLPFSLDACDQIDAAICLIHLGGDSSAEQQPSPQETRALSPETATMPRPKETTTSKPNPRSTKTRSRTPSERRKKKNSVRAKREVSSTPETVAQRTSPSTGSFTTPLDRPASSPQNLNTKSFQKSELTIKELCCAAILSHKSKRSSLSMIYSWAHANFPEEYPTRAEDPARSTCKRNNIRYNLTRHPEFQNAKRKEKAKKSSNGDSGLGGCWFLVDTEEARKLEAHVREKMMDVLGKPLPP